MVIIASQKELPSLTPHASYSISLKAYPKIKIEIPIFVKTTIKGRSLIKHLNAKRESALHPFENVTLYALDWVKKLE